jgi:hypothetical protein
MTIIRHGRRLKRPRKEPKTSFSSVTGISSNSILSKSDRDRRKKKSNKRLL